MNGISRYQLWKDVRYEGDEAYRPNILGILVPGARGRIFCTYYTAAGEGVHPTVTICHGFPGNEQNLDVAQNLRRIGMNVMTFHYSGSWGSDGDFSFTHCIEDAHTVIDYLHDHAQELHVDEDNTFILGHSMGGFVAFHLLAQRNDFRGGMLITPADFGAMIAEPADTLVGSNVRELFAEGAEWLSGTSYDALVADAQKFSDGGTFMDLAPRVVDKRILLIGAMKDTVTPIPTCIDPFIKRIDALGGRKLMYMGIDSDHMLADARCLLSEDLAAYLTRLMRDSVPVNGATD